MSCDEIREAISSALDGEEPGVPAGAVEAHLADCRACRAFADGARSLHRSVRLAPAPVVPDLTPRVLAAIGADDGPERRRILALRIALAVLGAIQVGLAVPELFGVDGGLAVHSARHLGSFSLALGVGFLFAALRPVRAAGLLPVVAVLVACLVGTSVLDVAAGRAAAVGETNHVTEVAGLVAAWLLVRPPGMRRPAPATA
ncbi:MAG TPA: zf-HC2 domain-containing protein [Acidimicrobiia bacterium]